MKWTYLAVLAASTAFADTPSTEGMPLWQQVIQPRETSTVDRQTTTVTQEGDVTQSQIRTETTAPSRGPVPVWQQTPQPGTTTITNTNETSDYVIDQVPP